jgi:hypothetical protein
LNKAAKLILAALVLAVLGSVAWIALSGGDSGDRVAVISYDGQELHRIELDTLMEPKTFHISGPDGEENLVLVERGRVRMDSANCPDQTCVKQGVITDSTVPIVCLPHKVIVKIVGGGGLDASN